MNTQEEPQQKKSREHEEDYLQEKCLSLYHS